MLHQLRQQISSLLKDSFPEIDPSLIKLEKPSSSQYGHLCTTAALVIAKAVKKNPWQIAQDLTSQLSEIPSISDCAEIELVRPGFINFRLNALGWAMALSSMQQDVLIERTNSPEDFLVEYVSANPTGDLHLGHGRGAVLGSSLVQILKAVGHSVQSEFYINDAGEQMKKLSRSAWKIYQGQNTSAENDEYPPELLKRYVTDLRSDLSEEEVAGQVKERIIDKQREVLESLGVSFEHWISEKKHIHESGLFGDILGELRTRDLTYSRDDALWLKSESLGDQRDRVLLKSQNQQPTYLAADLAYHSDKLARGQKLINIWGADHAGQEKSMLLSLQALGYDARRLQLLFLQLVSLSKDGQEVKMSKRTGSVITIEETVDEVGVDAFRGIMLTSHHNNRLVFDLDLLKQSNEKNPAFYLQYSHARACSVLRRSGEITSLEDVDRQTLMRAFDPELPEPEMSASCELMRELMFFSPVVHNAAQSLNPSAVLHYLLSLASTFHIFYDTPCKVLDIKDRELSKARLYLLVIFRNTMAKGLSILGMSAPETM